MDIEKYVSLIHKKALYFTPATYFEDLLEGAYTDLAIQRQMKQLENLGVSKEKRNDYERANENLRRFYKVSCWTLREKESNLMWKAYLRSSYGVAVQSSFERLRDALAIEEKDVFIGMVKYHNHATGDNFGDTDISRIISKDLAYRDESEIRAFIWDLPPNTEFQSLSEVDGVFVKVEIAKLFERVVVSPFAPSFFHDQINALNSRFRVDVPVEQSVIRLNNKL